MKPIACYTSINMQILQYCFIKCSLFTCVSAELAAHGTVRIITLPAIPIDDFIARLTVSFPHGAS
jgi:hypothetical protein